MSSIVVANGELAAARAGERCPKAGQLAGTKKRPLVCVKRKARLIWMAPNPSQSSSKKRVDSSTSTATSAPPATATTTTAAPLTCSTGGNCQVGDVGPGGGVIIYAEAFRSSWGRYIELAPAGWASPNSALALTKEDPAIIWCDSSSTSIAGARGPSIGAGLSNSSAMVAVCTAGAANLASSYRGGGLTDWHLPSVEEMRVIYNVAYLGNLGDLVRKQSYWTSTEDDAFTAFWFDLSAGGPASLSGFVDRFGVRWETKKSKMLVRPIRVFG